MPIAMGSNRPFRIKNFDFRSVYLCTDKNTQNRVRTEVLIMYNFGKKKNQTALAVIVMVIIVTMVLTTVLVALL